MTWTFTGFEARTGRVVARFQGQDGGSRAIPLDAAFWLPGQEDEQPHPDPAVHARLMRATRQLAAVARTARVVTEHDRGGRRGSAA